VQATYCVELVLVVSLATQATQPTQVQHNSSLPRVSLKRLNPSSKVSIFFYFFKLTQGKLPIVSDLYWLGPLLPKPPNQPKSETIAACLVRVSKRPNPKIL
jgi:hypothetical protein